MLKNGFSGELTLEQLASAGYIEVDRWDEAVVYGLGYERLVLVPNDNGKHVLVYATEGYADIQTESDIKQIIP